MSGTRRVTDATGRTLDVPRRPERIVSLVPSITEALFDLGVDSRIVGVTRFCIHPDDARERATVVGGTHDIDYDALARFEPDLVIANQEENPRAEVEKLRELYPTFVTFPRTAKDGVDLIRELGVLCDVESAAAPIVEEGERLLREVTGNKPEPAPRVVYLIWRNPWMTVNRDTFVHGMLETCGAVNGAAELEPRYPDITEEGLVSLRPDAVLLSSEPYNFQQRHADELLAHPALVDAGVAQVLFVDGEYCSWYGTRVVAGLRYVSEMVRRIRVRAS